MNERHAGGPAGKQRFGETPRDFDVICVGLAVGNIAVRPVSPAIFEAETTQVEAIEITGGGDAFNQSCVLSALGRKVALISKMSDDNLGNMMLAELRRRGADTSLVAMDPLVKTSSCVVMIHADGQRNFCTFKGCLRTFGEEDIDFAAVARAKVVSIGGLFALPAFDRSASLKLFKAARQAGAVTVADTKYDAFHIGYAGIRGLLQYTDFFLPSYDEAAYLSGRKEPADIARFFRDEGAGTVGIKLGGRGCYLLSESFEGVIPAFAAKAVDTTGAGDNFMGGFIHGLLSGWPVRDCALYGNAAGALCVTRLGATSREEYPEHIKEILRTTPDGERLLKGAMEK